MKYEGLLQGRWTGRIVDMQGLEGTLILDLRQERESPQVIGFFDITLGLEHAPLRQRGAVRGIVEKDHLKLAFEADKEQPVTIHLEGQLQALKVGGVGLCATYDVASKFFSPLQGGIVCASLDRPLSAVTIEAESVTKPGVKATRQTKRRAS